LRVFIVHSQGLSKKIHYIHIYR